MRGDCVISGVRLRKLKLVTVPMSIQIMQERIDKLEIEMTNMQQKILQLEQRFGSQPIPNDFAEYKGALFQKKFGGGYREAIFCLVCGSPMTPKASASHFGCFKCGHAASFPGLTVSEIIRELPANPATA